MSHFYSNGKLLLTGEYLVLDGALALAIPTKFGQTLRVSASSEKGLHWKSMDEQGNTWFQDMFSTASGMTPSTTSEISKTLQKILLEAQKLNPEFLKKEPSLKVITQLDFPRDWGLGSSSTVINNIALWAQVDAFQLLQNSFGGSGYDIAAAQHDSPIFYQWKTPHPRVEETQLNWNFKEQLHFVYLNQKQSSKKAIQAYREKPVPFKAIEEISLLSQSIATAPSLSVFEDLVNHHERIVSEILEIRPIKEQLFSDYPKAIKSLGGWGGDFILVVGALHEMDYFRKKGYPTILAFQEMIK